MKKFLSLILALALCLGLSVPAVAFDVPDVTVESNNENNNELVKNFWESINSGDWNQWISYYPSTLQPYYRNFATDENIAACVGILTVAHVYVGSISKVDNMYVPKMYPELQQYFEYEDTYECYKVNVTLEVKENNDYFSGGNSSYLTILVRDNGIWRVGVISGCANAEQSVVPLNISADSGGIGYGLIDLIPEPRTISVKDEKDIIHSNEKFADFILNVTCNEIGNMGYHVHAIRAQIIAAKMFGWWAKAGKYRASEGCDIRYGDVAYKSYKGATAENIAKIQEEVKSLEGFYMVSSVATGGKLFAGRYLAGEANTAGKSKGILYQKGANYLANTLGYNWFQILHYYYDNSSANNPNVGTVQIIDPTTSTVSVGDVDA